MSKSTRYLGLDVHAETISAALAQGRTPVQNLGKVQNRAGAIKTLIDRAVLTGRSISAHGAAAQVVDLDVSAV